MQSSSRVAGRSARLLRSRLAQQQKRWASHEAPKDHHHGDHHHAPANESFGSGFFIALLGIPAAMAVYHFSRPGKNGEEPYFSRKITELYAKYRKDDEFRNTLHTDAIEQAAADRALFLNDKYVNTKRLQHRSPDTFLNGGSPNNVPAGHGSANIAAVIEKYEKEAYEANEKRLQQLRDNAVPREQPFNRTMPKQAPAAAV